MPRSSRRVRIRSDAPRRAKLSCDSFNVVQFSDCNQLNATFKWERELEKLDFTAGKMLISSMNVSFP